MTTTPTGSTRFPFPHSELTPIIGKPTAITVKLLQKEVYANTRAVHCARGGGVNGYLGIAMDPATYFARADVSFVPPDHTGGQPVHAAAATAAQITATNRTYDSDLAEFRQCEEIREAIRRQILSAVEATYHDVLAKDEFGYADVTIPQILAHLRTNHATQTDDDLKVNRNQFAAAPWNPDAPIENLWLRIKHTSELWLPLVVNRYPTTW
jgi:hypothetical protein